VKLGGDIIMKQLEIFDFIDSTIEMLERNKEKLNDVSSIIEKYFENELCDNDNFLNVNSRVKSSISLKEKILRNNYYIKYKSPKLLFDNLSDLIGVRIECRFIEDEIEIYKRIKELFNSQKCDGYYYNAKNPNVLLKLDEEQPQVQKNGFTIFRIDGKYICNGKTVNFELQIKSLVNMFWGEVEHKILYKNFSYMLGEQFFKDIMASLKDNLTMIDRQLLILYNYLNEMNETTPEIRRAQTEALLSKIIYEIYSVKIKKEVGFVVDFRKSCDVVMSYVLKKNRPVERQEYTDIFIKVLERLNEISSNEICFNEYIEFEREIHFEDNFSKKIGESILQIINKDFKWNLLFRIIFDIELGNNAEDFEGFIYFLKDRFQENLSSNKNLNTRFNDKQKSEIMESIMNVIADSFIENRSIEFINDDNIESINLGINTVLNKITSYEIWKENVNYFIDEIKLSLKKIS
jgi:ppGpp synthetase/RelA/SpoT-type nucleotidyltranferase